MYSWTKIRNYQPSSAKKLNVICYLKKKSLEDRKYIFLGLQVESIKLERSTAKSSRITALSITVPDLHSYEHTLMVWKVTSKKRLSSNKRQREHDGSAARARTS